MDQTFVVTPDLDSVRESLTVLDAAGAGPTIAVIALFPEYSDWRLVISVPALDQINQMKAYDRVSEIWKGRFVYRLPPVLILSAKHAFVTELRRIFSDQIHVGQDTVTRLGGQTLGGLYMVDAFVLRATPMRGRTKGSIQHGLARLPLVAQG